MKIAGSDEAKTDKMSVKFFNELSRFAEESGFGDVFVNPPEEPVLSKIQNKFRKNISIVFPKNSKIGAKLRNYLAAMPKSYGITVTYDVDPMSEN